MSPVGMPLVMRCHVSPPSVERHMPLPGPLPANPNSRRRRWYVAATSVRPSGEMTTSVAPVFASTQSTFCQVAPPSFVRYRPRSSFGPNRCPTAATNTMFAIARIDDDAADRLRLAQSHVLPRVAAVDRAIDAVAPRGALTIVRFARARPNDARIARRDRDVADRQRVAVFVEHGVPGRAVVLAAKDSARRARDEDDARIARHRLDVVDSPAERRGSDVPPARVARPRLRDGQSLRRSRDLRQGGL